MLSVFLDEKTNKIILTFPDIILNKDDFVLFKEKEYVVTKKQFDVDANCYEYFLKTSE